MYLRSLFGFCLSWKENGKASTAPSHVDLYLFSIIWIIRLSKMPSKENENGRVAKIAVSRNYQVLNVREARRIAEEWVSRINLGGVVNFGLPEIDDRYDIWRVPLVNSVTKAAIGETVIDAKTSLIDEKRSTKQSVLETRLLGRKELERKKSSQTKYVLSSLRNTIACGDSERILQELPADSVDLVFTSPPYFNARPEYSTYLDYEDYLLKMKKVIHSVYRVLNEGRFFVLNVSPILIRRANRNESSKRLAVPFDFHRLFIDEGFDFVDDIIWVKPEGAGWASGRGRRFSADRNPLQYKSVPVTEYILVYRKRTDKLIDWFIRNHPDKEIVRQSKIADGYERTNVWHIKPAHNKHHPAVFPVELAAKIITYYSFKNDVVLDPFAGIGSVGEAAAKLSRRFVLIEINAEYVRIMKRKVASWLGDKAKEVLFLHCDSITEPLSYTTSIENFLKGSVDED